MQHGYPRSDPQEMEPRNNQSCFHYLCYTGLRVLQIGSILGNVIVVKISTSLLQSEQHEAEILKRLQSSLVHTKTSLCEFCTYLFG